MDCDCLNPLVNESGKRCRSPTCIADPIYSCSSCVGGTGAREGVNSSKTLNHLAWDLLIERYRAIKPALRASSTEEEEMESKINPLEEYISVKYGTSVFMTQEEFYCSDNANFDYVTRKKYDWIKYVFSCVYREILFCRCSPLILSSFSFIF